MSFSFTPFWRRNYFVRTVELEDCEALASLHEEGFVRPWSSGEFESLLRQDTVFGYAVVEEGVPSGPLCGFVLARHAAGEAEILTIVVPRKLRARGLGHQLMDSVLRHLHAERVESLFLEVDETNAPALALYRRLGFEEVGCRPAYYSNPGSPPTNALVMRRDRQA
ncbi:ribosomal-protein-alanine acetyltransferase [Nitratireductor aestuarii]|jgi:ribosomal-protein-alanine N-acetyltransferase|uniref:Ribosomal-protein-alanine acetyltransferase n=1 Tax=Nitratireductor aestuarii TaxID=1735103 RepID=A0A916RYM8_9HYPH|nr:GNAT family N-acetyltransferase [Nitratireductor aestuarii]GGA73212.1 ribosomal-protein-alanine acetyltransferase [Nitratireductor aestuarii]